METERERGRAAISWVLLPSLSLHLPPGQSDARAEIATWIITNQNKTASASSCQLAQPHCTGTSWRKSKTNDPLELLGFCLAISQVAISAPASDWTGGRHRGNEGSITQIIVPLDRERERARESLGCDGAVCLREVFKFHICCSLRGRRVRTCSFPSTCATARGYSSSIRTLNEYSLLWLRFVINGLKMYLNVHWVCFSIEGLLKLLNPSLSFCVV